MTITLNGAMELLAAILRPMEQHGDVTVYADPEGENPGFIGLAIKGGPHAPKASQIGVVITNGEIALAGNDVAVRALVRDKAEELLSDFENAGFDFKTGKWKL